MSNEIFDRETKLDLLVNVIPLFILGFFIVGFVVFAPFGIDPLASAIQFGLIAIPFVLLSVLTYFAAVAVAGSERSGPVYLPGQASVSDAEPLEVPGEDGEESAAGDGDADGELEGEHAALDGDAGDVDSDDSEDDTDEAGDTEEPAEAGDAAEDAEEDGAGDGTNDDAGGDADDDEADTERGA